MKVRTPNLNSPPILSRSVHRWAIALLGTGLATSASGQSDFRTADRSPNDLWRPRSAQSQPIGGQYEARGIHDKPTTIYESSTDSKWRTSSQLPASPWDQANSQPQATSTHPTSQQPFSAPSDASRTNTAKPLANGSVIRQPSALTQPYNFAGQVDSAHISPNSNSNVVAVQQRDGVLIDSTPTLTAPAPQAPAEPALYYYSEANPYTQTAHASPPTMPVEPHAQASAMAAATLSAMEADQYRKRFAGRVSTELLRDSRAPLAAPPPPVENPAGWKNIEEELRLRLTRCDEFLRRNAVLSARDEALAGLRLLIRNVDLRTGTSTGEPSLDRALRAFEEESDFHESIRNPAHGASTKAIVARHTTPILKQVDLETVSPELAAQHYRNFARFELYQATQNHPWAADLLYAFGKTIERRSATQGDDAGQWRNQAVVCYEVALTIAPNHPGSANQLGHVLLKLDRVDEAYAALYQSIQSRPSPEAWQSIAEIYRRRGYAAQADEAVRQATAIRSSTSNVPEVISLDPQTFIGISPNHFVGPTTAVAAGPVASPSTSAEKKSWFGKWWR